MPSNNHTPSTLNIRTDYNERESAMIKAFIFGTVAWRFQRLTRQLMGIGTAMGITTATQFLFLSTRQARTTAFQPPHIR